MYTSNKKETTQQQQKLFTESFYSETPCITYIITSYSLRLSLM